MLFHYKFLLITVIQGVYQGRYSFSAHSLHLLSLSEGRRRFLSSATGTTAAFLMESSQSREGSEQPKDEIRWGIVGVGDVTEKKSGPPFYKCKGSSLVAVMRRTPGKAAEWARRMVPGGQCVGYDNIDDFLRHDKLDAVYIATPPGKHAEICRKVAGAGKYVYVEKPVGRCSAETRAMVECMADAGKPLYTAYISRAYNRTQTLRKLLRDGCIGDRIVNVDYKFTGNIVPRDFDRNNVPWRLIPELSGGGEVMDIGCHVVDRIDYICGPLIGVEGTAENMNSSVQQAEDFVQLRAKIGPASWAAIPSDGATVACRWDFSGMSNSTEDDLTITGTKGYMKMVGMSPSLPIYVYDNSNKLIKQLDFPAPEHTAQPMIQAVTDDLRGISKAPFLSVGDNAVRTSQVLDNVLESYYGDREIGYWTRTKSS